MSTKQQRRTKRKADALKKRTRRIAAGKLESRIQRCRDESDRKAKGYRILTPISTVSNTN